MGYRPYAPPAPLLFGYDPYRDLPLDHLARLIERVVEETVPPARRDRGAGQPPYDPRLCVKVLLYAYCTGVRSSRVMERNCKENLAYLFLTRGDTPSYRTLCTARTAEGALVEKVWEGLFDIAATVGLTRLGRITVDSTKIRADASPEAVLSREEYAAVRAELARIQVEVARVDAQEAVAEHVGRTELGKVVRHEEMRDILRRVRRELREERRRSAAVPAAPSPPAAPSGEDAQPPTASRDRPIGGEVTPDGGNGGNGTLPLEGVLASAQVAEETTTEDGAKPMSAKMLRQIRAALVAIEAAECKDRKHLCLTDPDARMMYGERHRVTRECHSFEVATDQGLLVVGRASQEANDNACLEALVEAARAHEPEGVLAVDADSGYYAGEAVARLLHAGIDTCIPDSNTAGDLHRGQPIGTTSAKTRGKVPLTYDPETHSYQCPEGNRLVRTQHRRQAGQGLTVYRAEQACGDCPRRADCLTQPKAQHRTLKVADDQEVLEAARQRFQEEDHRKRYRHRGEQVETVFGFLRAVLGFTRWQLRGAKKVESEAKLFKAAYQFRKVHRARVG